jgi:hypothetical protein
MALSYGARRQMASARSLFGAGKRAANASHTSCTTWRWALGPPPAFSQVFSSLALVLADSGEGACTARLHASTDCLGVSGCVPALVDAPLEVPPLEPFSLEVPVLEPFSGLEVPPAAAPLWLLVALVPLDLEPLPPHPASGTPPRSAMTSHVHGFRMNDPLLRLTPVRRLPSSRAAILPAAPSPAA